MGRLHCSEAGSKDEYDTAGEGNGETAPGRREHCSEATKLRATQKSSVWVQHKVKGKQQTGALASMGGKGQ